MQQQRQQHLAQKAYLDNKSKQVLDLELNARYQKAQYETMYFAIEGNKIQEEYFKLLEKLKAEEEKFQLENNVEKEEEVTSEEV